MTENEKALEWSKLMRADQVKEHGEDDLTATWDVIIAALEKQIPKKAEWYDNDHTTCLCPNCNTEIDVWLGDFPDYCCDCGQKIDWSEVVV